jgi:hypothetical protein
MIVLRTEPPAPIRWQCSVCDDEGVISNWTDSPFDLRRRRLTLADHLTEIVISEDVAAALRELRLLDADCERLVFRIRAHNGRAVLSAADDLDELIGFVAAYANHESNRRRPAATRHRIRRAQQRGSGHRRAVIRVSLPEPDVARVQRWCAARVPEHARHQVRVECQLAPRHLTIVERRAPWRDEFGPEWTSLPIARPRYTAADKSWTLYCATATFASTSTTYCPVAQSRRPPDRDRPRPHPHLLGLTPPRPPATLLRAASHGATYRRHGGAGWVDIATASQYR